MCNLYRMRRGYEEIAGLFRAAALSPSNVGEQVYPGYPGLVVAQRQVRSMSWGFPLTLKGKNGQSLKPKPVNNTRTDKLDTRFWRPSFHQRRCLIPVEAFAEAEGPVGGKTRTWLSLPDRPVFACAGIWLDSFEWGPVYSMVMTDAANCTADVHDRMPVILAPEDEAQWIEGTPAEALALCRPWAGSVRIERTSESWVKRG